MYLKYSTTTSRLIFLCKKRAVFVAQKLHTNLLEMNVLVSYSGAGKYLVCSLIGRVQIHSLLNDEYPLLKTHL